MQAPSSLVKPIGYQYSSCGYCKKRSSSASYYCVTSLLSTEHYQCLVDRGWRRSGRTLYKPNLRKSCCPHYTIRLDTTQFKPSKDQRQTLNRWQKYVLGETCLRESARLHPKSKLEKAKRKNHFDLSESVHDCEYPNLPTPPEPEHGFEVTLEPDTFSESKFQLYENYQRLVHKEPPSRITRAGFRDFLCDSPLTRSTQKLANGKEKKLGSYHQCYYLDDRLVAIGVLDLLPHCVSGVYFIYHDDLSKWQFGKLGALREACLAGESEYRYYYMGYYIHSCVKMRYKASYTPQHVLDPETYDWDPLEPEYTHRLDRRRYVSLSRERKEGRDPLVKENIEGVKGLNVESKAAAGLPAETTASEEALSDLEGAQDVRTNKTEDEEYEEEEELDADGGGDLFTSGMPGILTPSEVLQLCDLDNTPIFVKPHLVTADRLVSWETSGGIDKVGSIKHVFAEFAACIGAELANDPSFVVSLS